MNLRLTFSKSTSHAVLRIRHLVMYRGEDAAEKFIRGLQPEAKKLFDEYNATTSHIFTKPLGDDKVREHCHIVGSYRDAAHSECNLIYV